MELFVQETGRSCSTQGESKPPLLPGSAMNPAYEYCLPAHLALVSNAAEARMASGHDSFKV